MNSSTINSKKAYLSKIVASLELKAEPGEGEKTDSELTKEREEKLLSEDERKTEERHKLLDPFLDQITDDMIKVQISKNMFLQKYCKDVENVRSNPLMLYAIADTLYRSGLLK